MRLDFQPKSESLIRSDSKELEQKNIIRRRNAGEENREQISKRRGLHTTDSVSMSKDMIAQNHQAMDDKKIDHHLDSMNNSQRIDLYA